MMWPIFLRFFSKTSFWWCLRTHSTPIFFYLAVKLGTKGLRLLMLHACWCVVVRKQYKNMHYVENFRIQEFVFHFLIPAMQIPDTHLFPQLWPFSRLFLVFPLALHSFQETVYRLTCVTTGNWSVSQGLSHSCLISGRNHFVCLTLYDFLLYHLFTIVKYFKISFNSY